MRIFLSEEYYTIKWIQYLNGIGQSFSIGSKIATLLWIRASNLTISSILLHQLNLITKFEFRWWGAAVERHHSPKKKWFLQGEEWPFQFWSWIEDPKVKSFNKTRSISLIIVNWSLQRKSFLKKASSST